MVHDLDAMLKKWAVGLIAILHWNSNRFWSCFWGPGTDSNHATGNHEISDNPENFPHSSQTRKGLELDAEDVYDCAHPSALIKSPVACLTFSTGPLNGERAGSQELEATRCDFVAIVLELS
jgi:hypothetical protein